MNITGCGEHSVKHLDAALTTVPLCCKLPSASSQEKVLNLGLGIHQAQSPTRALLALVLSAADRWRLPHWLATWLSCSLRASTFASSS